MVLDAFLAITITAAGIGFLIAVILGIISDFLHKHGFSSIQPELIIGHDVLGMHEPAEAVKEGIYALFLFAWLLTLAFILLWSSTWFQIFNGNSLPVAATFFSFALYLCIALVFMPLVNKGFFGARHHEHLPYWTLIMCVLYAILLIIFVPLAFGI